jgi:adenosylcobinamide-GDP ribazoletransferase
MSGLLAATSFLTRVPMPTPSDAGVRASLAWFPLVGALLGTWAAAWYLAASLVLPGLPAAVLATAALVVVTGALHEDGLADAADAWGGGSSREETLRILRDPHHGTYGVIALVLATGLRVAGLAALPVSAALVALVGIHALSRAAMVALLLSTPAARPDGLARMFGARVRRRPAIVSVLATAAIGTAFLGVAFGPAMAVALIVSVAVRQAALRRVGGITGDVLGAAQQLVETAVLLVLASIAVATAA